MLRRDAHFLLMPLLGTLVLVLAESAQAQARQLTSGKEKAASLEPKHLEMLWRDLSGPPAKAYKAMWALIEAPRQAVPFLRQRVLPRAPVKAERLQQLLRDLGSDHQKVSEAAFKELLGLRELAVLAVQRLLFEKLPKTMRERVEKLEAELEAAPKSPGYSRELRTVEALEEIGSVEALQVLEGLAKGAPGARLTQEAAVGVKRLRRLHGVAPDPAPAKKAEPPKKDTKPAADPPEAVRIDGQQLLGRHAAPVTPLAFSPEGTMLASAGRHRTAVGAFSSPSDHETSRTPFADSPTGGRGPAGAKRVDAFGDQLPEGAVARLGTVRLRHAGPVVALAFFPSGRRLVSGGADGVKIWDIKTGRLVARLLPKQSVFVLKIDHRGKWLAVGASGGVYLWDLATGEKKYQWTDLSNSATQLCFSEDGARLAAATTHFSWQAVVWDLENGKVLYKDEVLLQSSHIRSDGLTFLPEKITPAGSEFIFAEEGLTLTERLKYAVLKPGRTDLKEFGRGHQVQSLATDGRGSKVFAATADNKTVVLDATTGKEVKKFSIGGSQMAVDRPGNQVALTIDYRLRIAILSVNTGKVLDSFANSAPVSSLAFSWDSRLLASGSDLGVIQLRDIKAKVHLLELEGNYDGFPEAAFVDDHTVLWTNRLKQRLHRLDLASGNRKTVAVTEEGFWFLSPLASRLAVWRAAWRAGSLAIVELGTGKVLEKKEVKSTRSKFAFSPNASRIAQLDDGRAMTVWDAGVQKPFYEWTTAREMACVAFSHDSTELVLGGKGQGLIEHYDLNNRRLRAQIDLKGEPNNAVYSLLFLRCGHKLVVAHFAGLSLVDLHQKGIVQELDQWSNQPRLLRLSSNGLWFATGAVKEGTVELWETLTQRKVGAINAHEGGISSLSFSQRGSYLATGGVDNTVLVWSIDRFLGTGFRPASVPPGDVILLDRLWKELADTNPQVGLRAFRRFVVSGESALDFLARKVHVTIDANARQPNPSGKQHIARDISSFRAIYVLEALGTSQALAALGRLARGRRGALAEAARAALERSKE